MSEIMAETLPKELVDTLDKYLSEGKCVRDFRILGNSKGFTVTIHLVNPPCGDQDCWSPGISSKSPSTRRHDQQRFGEWQKSILEQSSPTLMNEKHTGDMVNKAISCDLGTTTEPYVNKVSEPDGELCCDRTDESKIDVQELERECKCNNDSIAKMSDTEVSLAQDDTHCSGSDASNDSVDTSKGNEENNDGQKGIKTHHSEATDNFNRNIMDRKRNLKYHKIVHDVRDGQSQVYGQTDDMIILVDEKNRKYDTWAINDRDKKCDEIYEVLQRWPSAKPDRCRYGVDTLNLLLPDILQRERNDIMV